MGKIKDLTGKRFGMLTVLSLSEKSKDGKTMWKCKCDCGKDIITRANSLQNGHAKSCGCLHASQIVSMKLPRNSTKKFCFDGTNILLFNMKIPTNNTSGVKGVIWDKSRNKWRSQIALKGKVYTIGRYDDINDAIEARKQAEEKLFKPIIEEFKSRAGD